LDYPSVGEFYDPSSHLSTVGFSQYDGGMTEKERMGHDLLAALLDMTLITADETRAVVAELLTRLGLTGSEAGLLWQLDPSASAPSMRQMASRLRRDPSTVTSLVDGLETKKLITRRLDPLNRRVKTLALTTKGRAVRQRLTEGMITRSPVAQLSEDDKRDLYKLLAKIVGADRLRADWGAASHATDKKRTNDVSSETRRRPGST
jgi:MarR family transcriptional regulator, organic hydroperoxide resistance regulator